MLQNVNAHKNEQRKCNVCTRKNNNRAKLKPERDARGRAERESARGNYDFGSLLLLFFFSLLWQKNTKKYMKLSRRKFPRIIYVRKDKNKNNKMLKRQLRWRREKRLIKAAAAATAAEIATTTTTATAIESNSN